MFGQVSPIVQSLYDSHIYFSHIISGLSLGMACFELGNKKSKFLNSWANISFSSIINWLHELNKHELIYSPQRYQLKSTHSFFSFPSRKKQLLMSPANSDDEAEWNISRSQHFVENIKQTKLVHVYNYNLITYS